MYAGYAACFPAAAAPLAAQINESVLLLWVSVNFNTVCSIAAIFSQEGFEGVGKGEGLGFPLLAQKSAAGLCSGTAAGP